MKTEHLAEDLLTLTHLVRPIRYSDLTPQQFWLLRHLRRKGPVNIGALAGVLGITTGSVTTACKRLEKAGLITRQRNTEDERVVKVALTQEGLDKIDIWRNRRLEAVVNMLSIFTPEEKTQLEGYIERLLEAAHNQGIEE